MSRSFGLSLKIVYSLNGLEEEIVKASGRKKEKQINFCFHTIQQIS